MARVKLSKDLLADFLAIKKLGGAVGKGLIEGIPGTIRDNKGMVGAGLLGMGAGAALHKGLSPSEDDVRKDEDSSMLRRFLALHGGEQ